MPREEGGRQKSLAFAAMFLFVVLSGGLVWMMAGPRGTTPVAVGPNSPLELVSLTHARQDKKLAVSGLVRNPAAGKPVEHLSAVVFLFDRMGTFVTSSRANVDFLKLGAGDESPFVVSLDAPASVSRYRVSFRTDDGIVPHIDRRGDRSQQSRVDSEEFSDQSTVKSPKKKEAVIMRRTLQNVVALTALVLALATSLLAQEQGGFKFKSGVELINVTATVTDRSGRFYSRLRKEDFIVYEDNKPVEVTHFSAERTPVSLGIVVDSSGSMAGEKWQAAVSSIDRFFRMMNDELDEFFLYRFSANADLVADWTNDRDRLALSIGRIHPNGGTAMYDAAAEAVPMAQSGQNRKKAVVIISDGNDTSSRASVSDVRRIVRETEVLVYAVGIDGQGSRRTSAATPPVQGPAPRLPIPFPFPGGGRGGGGRIPMPGYPADRRRRRQRTRRLFSVGADDRVNVMALREMTDDSGGRTEIVRDSRDLDPAVASIADELSQQYYLGYPSPGLQGRALAHDPGRVARSSR